MDTQGLKPKLMKGGDIKEIELLPQLKDTESLISQTAEYFYKASMSMDNISFPFKGFILEGPPGTGKTEIVKQVARKLDRRLHNVFLLFIDGASIASPRWGEAEKNIKNVFHTEMRNSKLIILFDDIESLMLARGTDIAKEWHFSINSILFHELDDLNPADTIVCATTNRPDLVDEALRTRLYRIEVGALPIADLEIIVRDVLKASGVEGEKYDSMVNIVLEKLKKMETPPTIRDARHITVVECIKHRVWTI